MLFHLQKGGQDGGKSFGISCHVFLRSYVLALKLESNSPTLGPSPLLFLSWSSTLPSFFHNSFPQGFLRG